MNRCQDRDVVRSIDRLSINGDQPTWAVPQIPVAQYFAPEGSLQPSPFRTEGGLHVAFCRHAQELQEAEGQSSRFLGKYYPFLPAITGNLHQDVQKAKLKLGKGKQLASNAVDTSFKARCKSQLNL